MAVIAQSDSGKVLLGCWQGVNAYIKVLTACCFGTKLLFLRRIDVGASACPRFEKTISIEALRTRRERYKLEMHQICS